MAAWAHCPCRHCSHMRTLNHLFSNNRDWAAKMERRQAGFFAGLARQQAPEYLWIGCSDSRVPANEIVGLRSGELFVHRNVANLVVHTDLNCMSVIQYAVETLKVRHIIVCGHYGCGGVTAALNGTTDGLVASWLTPLRDIAHKHRLLLAGLADADARLRRCCELNVVEQVRNVCDTPVVQIAWQSGMALSVHGWIYDISDGLLRDWGLCVVKPDEVEAVCDAAINAAAST
jgi:carbonic anhydrase